MIKAIWLYLRGRRMCKQFKASSFEEAEIKSTLCGKCEESLLRDNGLDERGQKVFEWLRKKFGDV